MTFLAPLQNLQIPDLPGASVLEQVFISLGIPDADIQYIVVARNVAGVSDGNRLVFIPAGAVPEFEAWLVERGFERQEDDPALHIWMRRLGKLPD